MFTTAGVPTEDRVERWQEHNSAALMSLRCSALTDTAFDGMAVDVQLAGAQLARVQADTAHVIERSSDLIRRQPEDAVVFFFVLVGEAFLYNSAGVHIAQSGQMFACDSDRPFVRGFSAPFEEVFLKIPRDVFHDLTGLRGLEAPLITTFTNERNLYATSLAGLIAAATRVDNPHLPAEGALLDLVRAVVGGGDVPPVAAYLTVACHYIESRLGDTSLSATDIARAVGISPRHLSRAFATTDTTVPQYVLGRRLAAAKEMLHRPDAYRTTIAEVAARCGFTSMAYFSKSFAAQFGKHASDVRRGAMRHPQAAPIGVPTAQQTTESAIAAQIGQEGPNV